MKNLITAITLMVVLAMGTIAANATTGILVGDRNGDTCTKQDDTTISDITGIIVAGFTGIIVAGRDGIIVAGRDGIIVAGKGSTPCEQQRDGVLLAD
jgi:hypothetical protein